MQLVVAWGIGLSLLLFFAKEVLLLYIARTRQHGILLETSSIKHYLHRIPPAVRILDVLLTIFSLTTIAIYILYMYNELAQSTVYHELNIIDVGIALLIYILYPSRTISHFITEEGLEQKDELTKWDNIYLVNVGKQTPIKRMTYIQFLARGRSIEGYIYDRDLPCLRKQLAPHSIMLIEIFSDSNRRE